MSDVNQSREPFALEPEPTPPPATPAPPSENDKLLGGLAYVSQFILPAVLPAIFLLGSEAKRSPFVRHHAVHGLALLAAAVIYELAATLIFVLGTAIVPPAACILWLLFLVPAVPFLYYGVLAFQGKYVEMPWLTQFLKNNSWL